MTYGDIQLNTPENKRIYYVYMWYTIENRQIVPFYVGLGSKNRYRVKSGRSKACADFIKKHPICYSKKLTEGFALEVARKIEIRVKEGFRELGFQLIDAEDDKTERKQRQAEGIAAMPIVDGKRVSTKTGRATGRPKGKYPDFKKYQKMKKDGLITVKEACEQLGISRSQWYALEKEQTA